MCYMLFSILFLPKRVHEDEEEEKHYAADKIKVTNFYFLMIITAMVFII